MKVRLALYQAPCGRIGQCASDEDFNAVHPNLGHPFSCSYNRDRSLRDAGRSDTGHFCAEARTGRGIHHDAAARTRVCERHGHEGLPGEWFDVGGRRIGVASIRTAADKASESGFACLGNHVNRSYPVDAFRWGACCPGGSKTVCRPKSYVGQPLLPGSAQRRFRDARNHLRRRGSCRSFLDSARAAQNAAHFGPGRQHGSRRAVLASKVLCPRLRPRYVGPSLKPLAAQRSLATQASVRFELLVCRLLIPKLLRLIPRATIDVLELAGPL